MLETVTLERELAESNFEESNLQLEELTAELAETRKELQMINMEREQTKTEEGASEEELKLALRKLHVEFQNMKNSYEVRLSNL
mmetsp:Transcript_23534/g.11329  ORF Transcript_23534/g.11329 Transcript_23534/m.11329 type:complete len:84 (+) Transcript_23534:306-557(+)|eukprot:CAMPEP_0201282704 /NCGR_PEP_ID=MMETSP1317-20130820/6423_1 /ASSEMBLY_ACC=CAM_ASM_000770 /TAXON_ID=187299 /ORGANISM="Undescribed Undescribed, Strain Undescribed" /LENGTH=83 /DNA_ID=CAMNT_0047596305 /DNA_START=360 /DNA_END=611 /DNA_ORIENTATION=-